MTQPKKFQQATVEAALAAFRSGRKFRRFLVADEVGLGKTVVAQQLVRRMMKPNDRPLVVIYMCSNLSIAAQNRRKLLEILPEPDRKAAVCDVDRLTLLPVSIRKPHHSSLHLYCLTPDTSLPMRRNRRRDGTQEERALIHVLMEREFPALFQEWKRTLFRRNAQVYWTSYLRAQREAATGQLGRAFRQSVQKEFSLEAGQQLVPRLRNLEELDIIAHLRNALAASALEDLKPDLVILDEFQRFRDVLAVNQDEAASRVVDLLVGERSENPPALLLLSATPYRLYARRLEQQRGSSHRDEFFDLVGFLYGRTETAKDKRRQCEQGFEVLESELLKGVPDSETTMKARQAIESILRPIMARTERAMLTSSEPGAAPTSLRAELLPGDLRVFKHASESLQRHHKSLAVPYWTSIPLPMQVMGQHYVGWRAASEILAGETPGLDRGMRDRLEAPRPWPHPRLRALRELLPSRRLLPPWMAPSAPWWKLSGPWKNDEDRPIKVLVFSRFHAVPQTIAAAVSFDLEAECLRGRSIPYEKVMRAGSLSARKKRQGLLALFHPSPVLVRETDPLAAAGRRPGDILKEMRGQVRALLRRRGIRIDAAAPRLPPWKVIRRLEAKSGMAEWTIGAWWELQRNTALVEGAEGGLAGLITDWQGEDEQPLEVVHPATVDRLARHALDAPGVIVGRALYRLWPEAVGESGFSSSLEASWNGLRTYLDQPFFLSLRKKGEDYPQTIARLAIAGNLEAVLDEHLWITSQLRSLEGADLADELRDGLRVKSGRFDVHPLGDKNPDNTFSIRCHVAMPFTQVKAVYRPDQKDEEKPLRPDELRKAFNTPFWPYVLATTSVGQEGLDFHVWCDSIVHWDLCRNPVDLEQREGRIRRFGGLAIRRAIVDRLRSDGKLPDVYRHHRSPWKQIATAAGRALADSSGLAPWWVLPGRSHEGNGAAGDIRRYVFEVPSSEQQHWLRWMREQLRLYRLALGQPNQEDFIEMLAAKGQVDPETVRRAVVNLSPWFSGKENGDHTR